MPLPNQELTRITESYELAIIEQARTKQLIAAAVNDHAIAPSELARRLAVPVADIIDTARTEATLNGTKTRIGIEELDAQLNGGIRSGSLTVISQMNSDSGLIGDGALESLLHEGLDAHVLYIGTDGYSDESVRAEVDAGRTVVVVWNVKATSSEELASYPLERRSPSGLVWRLASYHITVEYANDGSRRGKLKVSKVDGVTRPDAMEFDF